MANKSLIFDIFGRDKTASKTIRGVGKSAEGLSSKLGKLAGVMGLAFGAQAVVNFGKESVTAFMGAQKSQAKLADAFKRFPKLAGTNIKSLGKMNTALMKKTKFDDDATASAQATLAQYGLTGKQLEQLTPLMLDYAAKTGKDLPTAATTLGKALLGQGRGLKDIGVNFKDTKSLAGNFAEIMSTVSVKVGGFAVNEGATAAGKLEIMKNRFGEIQEKVGSALLPAFQAAADGVDTTLMPALEDAAQWMATEGIPALNDFAKGFGEVQKASYDFGYAMGGNLEPARQALYDFGYNVMGPIVENWTNFWKGVGYNGADLFTMLNQPAAKPGSSKPKAAPKKLPPALSGPVLPSPKQIGRPGAAFGSTGGVVQNIYPSVGMSEHTIGSIAANGINRELRRT